MSDFIEVKVVRDLEPLIPRFLANREKEIAKLKALLAAADFDGLKLAGHTLKGLGGGYGFHALTDFGALIESHAIAKDAAAISTVVADYADYMSRVKVKFE